jgi:hypothetical protein
MARMAATGLEENMSEKCMELLPDLTGKMKYLKTEMIGWVQILVLGINNVMVVSLLLYWIFNSVLGASRNRYKITTYFKTDLEECLENADHTYNQSGAIEVANDEAVEES